MRYEVIRFPQYYAIKDHNLAVAGAKDCYVFESRSLASTTRKCAQLNAQHRADCSHPHTSPGPEAR